MDFVIGFAVGLFLNVILFHRLFLRSHAVSTQHRLQLERRRNDALAGRSGEQQDDKKQPSAADILAKMPNDTMCDGGGEDARWAAVLVANAIALARLSSTLRHRLLSSLTTRLNPQTSQTFDQKTHLSPSASIVSLGPVVVSDLSLGSSFPRLSNARPAFTDAGLLRAEMFFNWEDSISISLETMVLFRCPGSTDGLVLADLPIHLVLQVTRISGTLCIELESAGEHNSSSFAALKISFLHDITIDMDIKSLVGDRTKINNMPKVADMVMTAIRNAVNDRLVWPNAISIPM